MIWTIEENPVAYGERYRISERGELVSYRHMLSLWQQNATFRWFFINQLVSSAHKASRWETPPITRATVDRPFEYVLIDSPGLARQQNPRPFASHIGHKDQGVVVFDNLGGDAAMVVPCAQSADTDQCHLLAFLRTAPDDQSHALWLAVGEAALERLSDKPMWISTAGGGVAWLHVRLDSWPKYYAHAPYRNDELGG